MRKLRALLAGLLILAGAGSAVADRVHLRDGETVAGRLKAISFTLSTATQGDLVIPVESLERFQFSEDGTVTLLLVDGQKLQGKLEVGEILLDRGLFANSYELSQIASIEVDPKSANSTIEKGTALRLMLADPLHSTSAEGGQAVRFCLSEDVYDGAGVVIAKGTPAIGEITTVRSAAAGSQQGELGVRLQFLLVGGGQRIPISGSADFAGGLDAGNFIAGGVLGFLGKGRNATVPPGTLFEAETATSFELRVTGQELNDESWLHCRRFFQFDGAAEVNIEDVDIHASYAPFGTSLTASIPLAPFDLETSKSRSLRNLLVFDVAIQSVTLISSQSRRSIKFDTTWALSVLPSHDKKVALKVEVVAGDQILASLSKLNIDAEEKKSRRVFMTVKCDREKFERATKEDPARLRFTMSVRE